MNPSFPTADRLAEQREFSDLLTQIVVKTAASQAQTGVLGDLVFAVSILLRLALSTAAGE